MNELKLPFYAKLALTLLSLVLIVIIVRTGSEVIIPLIFAFLISIMLLPLANLLEKWHFPRGLAAITSLLVFIILFLSVLMLLIKQMESFITDLPQLQHKLVITLNSIQAWVNEKFHINSNMQMSYLEKLAMGTLGTATSFVSTTLLSVSSMVIFIVFILLYTFFILLYRRMLVKFLISLFDAKHRETLMGVVERTRSIIKSYVGGLMIEMVVVAILNCIIFSILGIKYAILLGMMSAIFNLIPYIGIFVALLLCTVVTLATSVPLAGLQVAISLFLVHLVDSNILFPSIVGSKVKINALATIVGVILGNMLWGIPGMFLAIPVIAIVKILCESVDSMHPWAILLGVEEKPKKIKVPPAPKAEE
ncbi:putative PurR-regulated permease PerM [Chitinophaga dinghuensis]|uniref:Putative PurR-regulated permease PerM n=1 Tax=Chitinophaga dinghuensis TaxID=1539050 RepID=A0A327W141_9BACT|nr:AI-2E family transporter [Chitinophaga dinghuensis]RAJ82363.1 putative PurR-regulated permease PerM [Chitinophaga dinghuensis]